MNPQHRIHELLSELGELIGPGAYYDIAAPAMLSEWTTVLCWIDQNGDSYITQLSSENLLSHHADGLLHAGLYGEFGTIEFVEE